MARRVNVSMLTSLVKQSQTQEVQRGVPRTYDQNFPVFSTPVNQDILVYIPRVNVVSTENGENMEVLNSWIHDARIGKSFTSIRCINSLQGGVFDQLNYDGVCPACEATKEVWELYNLKLKNEAAVLNIDPQNDPNDSLKPIREKILQEMDLRGAEEYVTFPVVVIPTKARFTPTDDAIENLEVYFVHWRKKRYEDAILKALDSLMTNPGHPAGLFWQWNFKYDTKGKQPNARDSAKNAKYYPINDSQALELLKPLQEACEKRASEFTLVKAAEVVVAVQFMFKEDHEKEVNKIMAKTRQMLEIAQVGGGQPALPQGQQAGQLGLNNPLANFGQVETQTSSQGVVTGGGTVPPQQAPQGNPVKFG